MAKRKGSPVPSCSRAGKKVDRDAREPESIQWLDKLSHELWEKVVDNLEENDLFPLALSCRYFRQKQKKLVARTRQSGLESGKPRLSLKTNLQRKSERDEPASADYLRFCSKYKLAGDVGLQKAKYTRCLAAFHGHLPLLQELTVDWFTENKEDGAIIFVLTPVLDEAARGGQVETLRWLKTQKWFRMNPSIFCAASSGGQLEVLKWLRSEGLLWDVGLYGGACLRHAAKGGHFEVLRWLRSEGCSWDLRACFGAAEGGDLEMLKWLRSEGCPWDESACCSAAGRGDLEMLKWMRSEGCPLDQRVCHHAALYGHFEVLKWLRREGCPWDAYACAQAAEGGHLEVLKWLRSQDPPCPWHKIVCDIAAVRNHLDVLQWAIDNGCPYVVNMGTRPALQSLGFI